MSLKINHISNSRVRSAPNSCCQRRLAARTSGFGGTSDVPDPERSPVVATDKDRRGRILHDVERAAAEVAAIDLDERTRAILGSSGRNLVVEDPAVSTM